MFGQSTSGAFGTSAFGAPAVSTTGGMFGAQQPTTSLFGQTQPQQQAGGLFGQAPRPTSFFGNQATSAFGTTQPAAQTGLFGQQQPRASLFGQTQPVQPATTGGLFGAKPAAGTALFGASTNTSSLFGAQNTQAATQGSSVKFMPPTASDTMIRNGVSQNTQTKHQCITAMEQYKDKSLEEIRCEDYMLGRKSGAGAAVNAFGQPAAAPAATGLFGAPAATAQPTTSLFGQPQQKSVFGATTTASNLFGQPAASTGLFTSSFGKPAATTATGGLFGQPATNAFGTQATVAPAFGATNAFGQPQTQTNTFAFNQSQQAKPGGLFGATSAAPAPGLFGATSTASAFGTQPATTNAFGTSLFGAPKPATSAFTGFGQTQQPAAPAFGAAQPTTGLFGAAAPRPSGAFGTSFAAPAASTGMFGAPTAQPAFSMQQPRPAFPGFGAPATQSAFAMTTAAPALQQPMQSATIGTDVSQAAQQQAMLQATLSGMAMSPYGDNALAKLLPSTTTTARTTDPIKHQQVLNQSLNSSSLGAVMGSPPNLTQQRTQASRVNSSLLNSSASFNLALRQRPARRLTMPVHLNQSLLDTSQPALNTSTNMNKSALGSQFEDLFDDARIVKEGFLPRRNVKALVIRSASGSNSSATATPPPLAIRDSPTVPQNTPIMPAGNAWTKNQLKQSVVSPTVARLNLDQTSADSSLGNMSSVTDSVSTPSAAVQRDRLVANAHANNGVQVAGHVNGAGDTPEHTPYNGAKKQSVLIGQSPLVTSTVPKSTVAQQATVHVAGIRLSHSDYFTQPTLKQLAQYTDENGQCILTDGFTVGRTEYGSVFWPGEINITGLNLDDIVVFRHKEVTVYPDETKKPEEGQGLNRPAEITLERIWPNDRQTRLPIKDVERLAAMGYRDRLERASAEMGAAFRDYRPDTGAWVFEVPHFTKYGLGEDEECEHMPQMTDIDLMKQKLRHEEQLQASVQRAKVPLSPTAMRVPLSMRGDNGNVSVVSSKEPIGLGGHLYDDEMSQDEFEPDLNVSAALCSVAANTSRLLRDTMQQSYNQSADVLLCQSSMLLPEQSSRDQHSTIQHLLQQSQLLCQTTEAQSGLDGDQSLMVLGDKQSLVAHAVPELVQPKYRLVSVPLQQSVTDGQQHLHADSGLFNARRARPSFSPAQALVTAVSLPTALLVTGAGAGASGQYQSVGAVQLQPITANTHSAVLDSYVHTQLEHTECEQAVACPRLMPELDLATVREYKLITDVPEFEQSIWSLCMALWGDLELQAPSQSTYQEMQRRKMAVGECIADMFQARLDQQLKLASSTSERVLTYVLHGRVQQAVTCAINNKHMRLAVLLSASLSNNALTQHTMRKQLAQLAITGAESYMDAATYKCYLLCAGALNGSRKTRKGAQEVLQCCEGLPWLLAFAMHIWYVCAATADLGDVLRAYSTSCQDPSIVCARALAADNTHTDVRHSLIQLFVHADTDMHMLLNTAACSTHVTDLHISWHVWCVLRAVGYTQFSDWLEDSLHLQYSAQLITEHQLYLHALFVIMHINDHFLRTTELRDVLCRCVFTMSNDVSVGSAHWVHMVERLGIPQKWLFDAMRLRAQAQGDQPLAFECALKAERWTDAHRLFVTHVAPLLIINEEPNDIRLRSALQQLSEHSDTIHDWQTGALVYMDYVQLMDTVNNLDCAQPDSLDQVRQLLQMLRDRLTHISCDTLHQRVARTEMSSRALQLCRHVLSIADRSRSGLQLPLPQDSVVDEQRDLLLDMAQMGTHS